MPPTVSVTFFLSAVCNRALRSGAIDGGLFRAPSGLPLCPGLNWCSRGGHPGPTRYSGFVAAGLGVLREVMRRRRAGFELEVAIVFFAVALPGALRCDTAVPRRGWAHQRGLCERLDTEIAAQREPDRERDIDGRREDGALRSGEGRARQRIIVAHMILVAVIEKLRIDPVGR